MKHLYFVFLIALLMPFFGTAQQCITQNTVNITGRVTVGKGVCTNAANSSLLELGLDGVNRAFRLVRGDTAVFNTTITNGSGGNGYGLMCYQISDEGLYYHNNTRWVHLLDANLDKYVTGASYNSLTGDLTLTRTAPLSNLVVNLSALADNIYTVDGIQDDPYRVYNGNNSDITFNNGGFFSVSYDRAQIEGATDVSLNSEKDTYVVSGEYTHIVSDQKDSLSGTFRVGGVVTIGERHLVPLSPSDSVRIVASEKIILSVLDTDSPFSPVTNKQILLKGLKESNCDTVVTIRTGGKLEYTKSTDLLCNAVQQAPIATYASGVYLLGTGGGGGASIPPTWIGWDFDIPTDFAPATSALNLGFHHIYLNGMLYPYPPATGSPSTPTLGTNDTGINAHISASLVLAGFGANDIIWVSNPDNTVTIWVNPAYPVNGNEFWCGSMTPDDYNKHFPVIPTTHAPPTGSGCALYDISALTPIPTQREVFYVAAPATSISTTLTLSTNQLHNYIYDDGQLLAYGYDYTVSGSTITWIGGVLNRSGVFQIVINQ